MHKSLDYNETVENIEHFPALVCVFFRETDWSYRHIQFPLSSSAGSPTLTASEMFLWSLNDNEVTQDKIL